MHFDVSIPGSKGFNFLTDLFTNEAVVSDPKNITKKALKIIKRLNILSPRITIS